MLARIGAGRPAVVFLIVGLAFTLLVGCGSREIEVEGAIQPEEEWLQSLSPQERAEYERLGDYPYMSYEELELIDEMGASPFDFPPGSQERATLRELADEMESRGIDADIILQERF